MSTIVITVGGVDITNNVLFSSANFESQLGAIPGSFDITVKDEEQTLSFITGDEITLDIDSVRYYGGYVTQVSRKLALPVDDTTTPSTVRTRQWVLRGVDYNILFDKRVVFNKADPTSLIPIQPTTTTDQALISLLVNDYLDLSSDTGLDTATFVSAVADPTPTGGEWGFVNPGDPWRKQMQSLANLTGAIWYIDASKRLHYQTVESVAASWGFADKPNKTTTFGFRELEFIEDATNVVNDALVWGGSPFGSSGVTSETVFARVQNTTSQASVGRWQTAEQHFNEVGYFEASGCEVRGNVIVYGGPDGVAGDGTRGLQNPAQNVRLSWFSGGVPTPLTPGQVITVFLYVYGPPPKQVTVPVRSVRISFPTPTEVRFDGFLGIQTSDPWSLWKYLRQAASQTTRFVTPTVLASDGTGDAVVSGTRVCQSPLPLAVDGESVFTVSHGYIALTTEVFLNGLLQRPGYEYTETNPTSGIITMAAPLVDGDQLWVCYYASGA